MALCLDHQLSSWDALALNRAAPGSLRQGIGRSPAGGVGCLAWLQQEPGAKVVDGVLAEAVHTCDRAWAGLALPLEFRCCGEGLRGSRRPRGQTQQPTATNQQPRVKG